MNCEQIQPNLLDYSRGLLSRPESEEVRRHIAKCDECAALLEDEAAFAGQLSVMPYEQAANDVWALVRARTKPSRFRSIAALPKMLTARVARMTAVAVAAGAILATAYSLKPPAPPTQPNITRPGVTVAVVSDDPLGSHSDAMIDVIDKM